MISFLWFFKESDSLNPIHLSKWSFWELSVKFRHANEQNLDIITALILSFSVFLLLCSYLKIIWQLVSCNPKSCNGGVVASRRFLLKSRVGPFCVALACSSRSWGVFYCVIFHSEVSTRLGSNSTHALNPTTDWQSVRMSPSSANSSRDGLRRPQKRYRELRKRIEFTKYITWIYYIFILADW